MIAAPSDQVRVSARNVTQLDSAFVAQPVTSGLTATLTILDWESGAVIDGPDAMIQSGLTDDYYLDITAPSDVGRYRLVVELSKGGGSRALNGLLEVVANPPT